MVCIIEDNFQIQAPGGLIFGGAYYRRYFCVLDLGGFYTEGLIHGGAYFLEFLRYFSAFKVPITLK